MDDPTFDIREMHPDLMEILLQCEVTGRRTVFLHGEREVAVLVSWDEYVALRETIAIAADPVLRADLQSAESELTANMLMLPEDLFVE